MPDLGGERRFAPASLLWAAPYLVRKAVLSYHEGECSWSRGSDAVRPLWRGGRGGAVLLETVIALALISMVLPPLLSSLAAAIGMTDDVYDRSVLLELAQGQMEDIQRQGYQENAGNYTLITAPAGYAIAVSATPAADYIYPAPLSSAAQQTVQLVTVTVTGVRGDLSLEAYKVRR